MKYGIDYRYLPKGATKPVENTSFARPVDVEVDDSHFALIPMVGDYVHMQGENDFRNIEFRGQVKTRHFDYVMGYCYVTIVVAECDAEWDMVKP